MYIFVITSNVNKVAPFVCKHKVLCIALQTLRELRSEVFANFSTKNKTIPKPALQHICVTFRLVFIVYYNTCLFPN